MSLRPLKRALLAGGLAVVAVMGVSGCALVAAAKQDSALTRCTYTPPDDPYLADRRGTVSVDWKLFGYDCQYTHDDGSVVRRPPA